MIERTVGFCILLILVAVIVAPMSILSSCTSDKSEKVKVRPSKRAFTVHNGEMRYVIDPLNEICTASSYYSHHAVITHEDCLRLIQRYTIPLVEVE